MTQPRIGITGWPFRDWSAERTLVKVHEYGINYLDFWPEMRGEASSEAVIQRAEQLGVTLYCYNVPDKPRLGAWDSGDAVRADLIARIREAKQLQIPNVQLYGGASPGRSPDATARECAEVLKPVIEYADAVDVTLWFENDYDESGTDRDRSAINRTPEAVRALLEAVGSPRLKATYDTCNFVIAGSEGFPFGYELLRPYIANVHVKDARHYDRSLLGEVPAGTVLTSDVVQGQYVPVPAGQGTANLDALLRRMVADHYDGFVTLDALCRAEQADQFFPGDLRFVRERFESGRPLVKEEIPR